MDSGYSNMDMGEHTRNMRDYSGKLVNGTVQVHRQIGRTKDKLVVWEATCLNCPGGVLCGKSFPITSAGIRKGVFSCGCQIEYHNAQQAIQRIFK